MAAAADSLLGSEAHRDRCPHSCTRRCPCRCGTRPPTRHGTCSPQEHMRRMAFLPFRSSDGYLDSCAPPHEALNQNVQVRVGGVLGTKPQECCCGDDCLLQTRHSRTSKDSFEANHDMQEFGVLGDSHLSPFTKRQLPVPWRRPPLQRPWYLSPHSSRQLPAQVK